MSASDLINEARDLGLCLQLNENGRLSIHPGDSDIPKDFLAKLKAAKTEIIDFFNKNKLSQSLPPITKAEHQDWFPLTMAQQELWIASKRNPDEALFLIRSAFRVEGDLNKEKLHAAFATLINHHKALSLCIRDFDGTPKQRFRTHLEILEMPFDVRYIDSDLIAKKEVRSICNSPLSVDRDLLQFILLQSKDNVHYIIFKLHHIIADGISMQILFNDLSKIYNGYDVANTKSLDFKDYAIWENSQKVRNIYLDKLSYWQSHLSNYTSFEFPKLNSGIYNSNFRSQTAIKKIEKSLVEKIRRLAGQAQVSPNILMMTAFYLLISRYSCSKDIVLGVPNMNRHDLELGNCIGLFVNLLPMRLTIDAADCFFDLIAKVKRGYLDSYDYQCVPFGMINRKWLSTTDSKSLVNITYNYSIAQELCFGLDNLLVKPINLEISSSPDAVSLAIKENPEGWVLYLDYNLSIMASASANNFLQHYYNLLESMVCFPGKQVTKINFLTSNENYNLKSNWNDTSKEHLLENNLSSLLHERFTSYMNLDALIFNNEKMTFGALDRNSMAISNYLHAHDIGRNDLIVIMLERSMLQVCAIVGVLYSGAGYVPIELDAPKDRIKHILSDVQPKAIVTTKENFNNLNTIYNGEIILADALLKNQDKVQALNGARYIAHNRPDDIAYIIYTSGSTGKPKGTIIKHASIASFISWVADEYPLHKHDKMLYMTSYAFDASLEAIFYPLVSSAKLIIMPNGEHKDIYKLIDTINQEQVTILDLVPSVLSLFIEAGGVEKCRSLHQIIVGGEVLSSKDVAYICSRSNIKLINTYGPTEATVEATHYLCRQLKPSSAVPIGRPIANMRAYIMDDDFCLLPPCVPGQLCLSGVGIAKGYLNSEQLADDKFVPNPYGENLHNRLYKTGDIAKWGGDGLLYYMGRADHQVKLHGQRIELEEIESALGKHTSILLAAVIMKRVGAKQFLVAFYTTTIAVDALTLRDHLISTLPTYMIPAHFVEIDSFPMTASDKIDRQALQLKQVANEQKNLNNVTESPVTDTEKIIHKIWAETLGITGCSVHDNFFHLGGDSITMMRILVLLRQKNVYITIKDFFTYPTISTLSRVAADADKLDINNQLIGNEQILTPIQKWYFNQNYLNVHHWNQMFCLRMRSSTRSDLLEQAISIVAKTHDIFKLFFLKSGGVWHAHYTNQTNYKYSCVDLSSANEKVQLERMEIISQKAQESLHIAKGPMLIFLHFQLTGAESRLAIIAHHLIIDGVSWRILIDDISSAYSCLRNGTAVNLPIKTTTYQAWSKELKNYSYTIPEKIVEYWDSLRVKQHIKLPVDHPNGENNFASQDRIRLSLDELTTDLLLKKVVAQFDVSINSVLLAPLAAAFADTFGCRSLLVDMESHGRDGLDDLDVSHTMGWFTNIYPILIQSPRDSVFANEVRIIDNMLKSVPSKGFDYLLLGGANNDTCLQPELSFNYLGKFGGSTLEHTIFDMAYESFGFPVDLRNARSHLFSIVIAVVDNRLSIDWNFSKNMYHKETVSKLADCYLSQIKLLASLREYKNDKSHI